MGSRRARISSKDEAQGDAELTKGGSNRRRCIEAILQAKTSRDEDQAMEKVELPAVGWLSRDEDSEAAWPESPNELRAHVCIQQRSVSFFLVSLIRLCESSIEILRTLLLALLPPL